MQAAKEQAVTDAQIERRRDKAKFELPPALAGIDANLRKVDDTMNTARAALAQVNAGTAGFIGSLTSGIAGTTAFDLKANVKTIQANLGFDELAQMRAASKTGGALGQVSERELDLLISAKNSLDVRQSPAQLKENFEKVLLHYDNYRREINIMKQKLIEQANAPNVIDFADLPLR